MFAGLKKWSPMTISGRWVAEAIWSMFSDEVLVARTHDWLGDGVEVAEDLLFCWQVFEDGFYDDVGLIEGVVG